MPSVIKLGYITKENPADKKAYSGTHFNMMQALEKYFAEVLPIGPIDSHYNFIPRVKGRLFKALSGKIYKYQYNIDLAKRASAVIDKKINQLKPDVLLASLMSPEVAYLKSEIPLFITTDATFPLLQDFYESHSNLHSISIREAIHLEERAFRRAKKLILPLNWLADSAMNDYGIPASNIEVVPYGSNLDIDVSKEEIDEIIENRRKSPAINLLFVGIRWEEKGGPFAVEVLQELINMGCKAELQIVGCMPEIPDKPDRVNSIGFLDKGNLSDNKKLNKYYKEASFFIMPTKAECVGMSFIEAASLALPAIGTEVGGVPEAVAHDKTGYIIKRGGTPKEAAKWIFETWSDKKKYRQISEKAYSTYINRMNWENWGKTCLRITAESIA